MPREIVKSHAGPWHVKVGWGGPFGEDLQIGLETDDGQSMQDVLQGDFGSAGLWGHLDRDGANRLIRILRRARDATFGADA